MMQENIEFQKIRHFKDGEVRDAKGRWSGKVVTVRSEYYALIEAWQKQSGKKKAEFWREAVMRGSVEIAKLHGIEASFPVLEDCSSVKVKPKRKFPTWLFRKK